MSTFNLSEEYIYNSCHSYERAKERAGLKRKRAERMIELARVRGKSYEECSWSMDKRYLYKKSDDETIALYCHEDGLPVETTAITFTSLNWINDVPASGGIANKNNCSYAITAYYEDSTTGNVTNHATIVGSLSVPSSEIMSRHEVGILTLTATYGAFSVSNSVTAYQAAFVPYLNVSPSAITFTANGGVAIINVESNTDWTVQDNS